MTNSIERGRSLATPALLAMLILTACGTSSRIRETNSAHWHIDTPRVQSCNAVRRFEPLIVAHVARYPKMQAADAMKLLHHAVMGSEHAITDTAAVVQWMDREWSSMGTGPVEPLVDTLGTNGKYARIHLRPYKARNADKSRLVTAFIETGRHARGDTTLLACALDEVAQLAARRAVPFDVETWSAASREWRMKGFPAVSHSTEFRTAYAPAYRVVATELIASILGP